MWNAMHSSKYIYDYHYLFIYLRIFNLFNDTTIYSDYAVIRLNLIKPTGHVMHQQV